MDGIEKITARISKDNEEEIRAITETAQKRAEEIRLGYEKEAEELSSAIKSKGKLAVTERKEQLAGASQTEVKKMMLAVKQDILDEAFQKALQELSSLPEEDYVALLTDLAVKGTRTGCEQLIFSPTDRTRFGKKVVTAANSRLEKVGSKAALTLSETSRPMKGGLILNDSKVEINCTFETTLRLLRKDAASRVATLLFDETPARF
jgi:V/A-type H+-transporting ATPase subunit E